MGDLFDLFAGDESAAASLEKNSLETKATGGTPKNFEDDRVNIHQTVEHPKIHPDTLQKIAQPTSPASDTAIPIPAPKRGRRAKPKKKEGVPTTPEIRYVSSRLKPPSEEALKAEGAIIEPEDMPNRSDKWRPGWRARKHHPFRKGYEPNKETVALLNYRAQVPKPDVIDIQHARKTTPSGRIPWDLVFPDLLEHLAAGGTMAGYCRAAGLSYGVLTNRIEAHPEWKPELQKAREMGADALATEALEIASNPCMTEEQITVYDKNNEIVTKSVKLADNTYARKLAFQARMQLLEKWAPDKYGPNAKAEVGGGMAEKLRAARARIRTEMREFKQSLKEEASESGTS